MREIQKVVVAVVGGAGFLGSHLVNHLIDDRDCDVIVVDNLVVGRREFIHPKATFVHHDITGSELYLKCLFEHHKVQYAFNYVAMPYIPDSFKRPLRVFDINAMGALKVINAAQEAGVKGILQVSSAEIYGDAGHGQAYSGTCCISEENVVRPHSSYGAAKAAIDAMVQVRWRESQTPCIALRQFNCVGERETHPYVVPEIISQLSQQLKEYYKADDSIMSALAGIPGMTVVERGGLRNLSATVRLGNNSTRDFQYAGDAVRMATELLEKGEFGEGYNMGSEGSIKIYDLAVKIGELMGVGKVEVVPDPSRVRPWEIWHLQSNNSKLYSVIKSRPQVSLDDALLRTILDFKNNGNKWSWQ